MTEITNRFTIVVEASFPKGEAGSQVLQWLNTQHTGKPTVPLDVTVSEEHKEASYMVHACRRVKLTFQINKEGHWSLVNSEML